MANPKIWAAACCAVSLAALPPAQGDDGPSAASGCAGLGLKFCPVPYDSRIPDPKDMLIWSQAQRIIGFRNTYRMYGGDVFHAGGTAYPLPPAHALLPDIRYRLGGRQYGLEDYLRHQSVTGLLVLKDGAVAYEYYGGGNTPKTLWTSRSVAKSVVSILIGIAIAEGAIRSVDDPIVSYLPELRDGAWGGVSLRQLLQHTSGVAWNENYADPHSEFARLTRCEADPAPYDCVFGLVRSGVPVRRAGSSVRCVGAVALGSVGGKALARVSVCRYFAWQSMRTSREQAANFPPGRTCARPRGRPRVGRLRLSRLWWIVLVAARMAHADGGPFGIDHELPLDQNGIWARKYQTGIEYGAIAVEVAGSLWLGNDDELGHALWQTIDASVLSGIAATLLKDTVGRPRPYQDNDPNVWLRGRSYQSFPSGEVTLQASFVTPLILDYYKEHPWVWALEALPVYDAIARLKSQAHWQTDVIAGGLLGTGFGYWAARRTTPLSVQILPTGVSVGFSRRF